MSLKGLISFIVHFTKILKKFYEKQREDNKVLYMKSNTYYRSSSIEMKKNFMQSFSRVGSFVNLKGSNKIKGSLISTVQSKQSLLNNSHKIQTQKSQIIRLYSNQTDQSNSQKNSLFDSKPKPNIKDLKDLPKIQEFNISDSPKFKLKKKISFQNSKNLSLSSSDTFQNLKKAELQNSIPKSNFQSQNLKTNKLFNKNEINLKQDIDLFSKKETIIKKNKEKLDKFEELRKTNFEGDRLIPISSTLSKEISRKLNHKSKLDIAISLFNSKPKKGEFELSKISPIYHSNKDVSLRNLSKFLYECDKISKKRLGEFFGYEGNEYNKKFLYFLDNFDFTSSHIDECIRKVLIKIELPRESQQIDRILFGISQKYFNHISKNQIKPKSHTSVISILTEELVYQISYSLMMIQTCLHNKQVEQKMDKPSYVASLQYVSNYDTLKKSGYLEYLYDSIKNEPLINLSSYINTSGKKSEELFNEVLKKLNEKNIKSPSKKLIQIESESDKINVINKIFENHLSMKFFNTLLISYQRENKANILE